MVRIFTLISALFLFVNYTLWAQLLPPNQPEQDACNALLLCGNSFTSPYSYDGIGVVTDLPSTPCGGGEGHSMWVRLEVNAPGIIVFEIIPLSPNDDYDFAVLDITGGDCSNLSTTNVIRCNFNNNNPGSNVNGIIGLNTTSTLNFVAGGTFGNSYCAQIDAAAGDVYLLMINNFGNYVTGGISSGFTLDFTGTTATFNQPPPPALDQIVPYCDVSQEVIVQLNTNVQCNSIAADGSDFTLSSGSVVSAEGVNCSGSGGYTNQVRVAFGSPLANGDYNLYAATGSDNNTLLGLCGSALALPDSLTFHVGIDPIEVSIDSPACQKIRLHLNSPAACNTLTSTGSEFAITGPSTVSIASATGAGCGGSTFTQVVELTLSQPIAVDGEYTLTARIGTDGNTMADTCGRIIMPGLIDRFWVNSFDGQLQTMPDTSICNAGDPLPLSGTNTGMAPPGGFQYKWTPSEGIEDPASLSTSAVMTSFINFFVVETVDAYGCYLRDSLTVKVQPLVADIQPSDASICLGSPLPITASGGDVFEWYDNSTFSGTPQYLSCSNCPTTYAGPPVGTHTYYAIVSDASGCRDTVLALVEVLPLPVITATPEDTVIRYGDGIRLLAEGGVRYDWTPVGSLDNPSRSDPYAQPVKNTVYLVSGYDAAGCRNIDSVVVAIDFRAPTFIPNAFTPNGDGVNDVFGLQHLRSQRLLDFRIFNRWGNLVFQTQDAKEGWDGTFQNAPADPDVYYYLIEIAYPDDYRETFKGDVLLVR